MTNLILLGLNPWDSMDSSEVPFRTISITSGMCTIVLECTELVNPGGELSIPLETGPISVPDLSEVNKPFEMLRNSPKLRL
jgi:hypothetical protein